MARAEYDVNEGVKPKGESNPAGDKSFRACIAALLAFLLLCVILIIVSAVIRNQRKDHAASSGDASKQGNFDSYGENRTKTTYYDEFGSTESTTVSSAGRMENETKVTEDPRYGKIIANLTSTTFSTTQDVTTSTTSAIEATKSTFTLPPMVHNVTVNSTTTSSFMASGSSSSQDLNDLDKFSSHHPQATSTTKQYDQMSASDVLTSTEDYSSEASASVHESPATEASAASGGTSVSYLLYGSSTEYTENNSSKDSATVHEIPSTTVSTVHGGTSEYHLLYGSSTEYSTESTSVEGSGESPASTVSEGTSDEYIGSTTGATNDYITFSTDESSSSAPLTVARKIAPESEECVTNACYKQAVHMLSMMNHTMDPCENFYVYACGGLQTNPNLLQPDPEKHISQKIYSVMESASESSSPSLVKMKNFYHSCIAHHGSANNTYVFQVLEKIFEYNHNLTSSTIYTELFSMLLKYNSSPLFDVLIDVEDKINPHFVFKIVDPQYSPSVFSYDKHSEDCKHNVSKFERKNGKPIHMDYTYLKYKRCKFQKNKDLRDTIIEYLKIFEYDYLNTDDTKRALGDLLSLMSLFSNIANIRHGLLYKEYVAMSVKDLQNNYPLINWMTLFSNLVNDNTTVKETHKVQVYFKSTFDTIFEKLQNFTQSDPLYTVHMNSALFALSLHRMVNDIVTVHNPYNRHDYCMNIVKTLMTDIASTAYLSSFTYKELLELKLRASKTFRQLKYTIREQLTEVVWLDEQSKSTTIEQLDKMSIAADGGMDFYHNFSYADSIWKNVVIEKDNYLQNALDLVLFRRNLAYSLYGKDPRNPKYIWSHFKYPINLGAHFIYGLNMIIIPTSLLSLESNNVDLPQYIRMASEGFIMAHEIAHTFDFTGIMFGPYGKGDSQLTLNAKSTYDMMEYCYNNQYDYLSSFLAEDGYHLDFKTESMLSNNERFSDYTGIKLAYDTFIKNFSYENKLPFLVKQNQNQLFFLQVAQEFCSKDLTYDHFVSIYEDEHLPSAIRVKNMMSNTKEFLDVFKCKKNSKMHTGNPCEPFPHLTEDDMSVYNR